MQILVNATSVRLGGGITVLRNLLPALTEADGGRHRYVVIAHEDSADIIDPRRSRVVVETARAGKSLVSRMSWEQLRLPLRSLIDRADVVFSPGGIAVLGCPKPQVLMFQNMAPFEARVVARAPTPKRHRLLLLRHLGALSGRLAQRVVFISDYARNAIAPLIGGGSQRSRVIHLGRDEAFQPSAATGAGADATAARFALPARYLLSVSQFYFHKNFLELIDAFATAIPDLPDDVALVIAGGEHEPAYARAVRERIEVRGLGARVRLLGEVPYSDLPTLYARCLAVIFPSVVESFPNVLVEGLASGAPTFASALGPMKEIAGDAAEYFDPYDRAAISRAISRACSETELRDGMRARGIARASQFTWNKTAHELLGVMEAAA